MALAGKRGLVVGVVNQRSIAWAVARQWRAAGCDVAVTYQDERARPHVEKLVAREWGDEAAAGLLRCDVRRDDELAAVATALGERFEGRLDALLHGAAFAPPEAFAAGSLLHTPRDAWQTTLDVSAYSLLALTRELHPLLRAAAEGVAGGAVPHGGPAVTTLSYLGARRVVPNYLAMGPAKAALEAAARGLAAELGPDGIRVNIIRYIPPPRPHPRPRQLPVHVRVRVQPGACAHGRGAQHPWLQPDGAVRDRAVAAAPERHRGRCGRARDLPRQRRRRCDHGADAACGCRPQRRGRVKVALCTPRTRTQVVTPCPGRCAS